MPGYLLPLIAVAALLTVAILMSRRASKKSLPEETRGERNGYPYVARSEDRDLGSRYTVSSDTPQSTTRRFLRVTIPLRAATPHLRILAREPLGSYAGHQLDKNAGAVATGHPRFDDQYLVFC